MSENSPQKGLDYLKNRGLWCGRGEEMGEKKLTQEELLRILDCMITDYQMEIGWNKKWAQTYTQLKEIVEKHFEFVALIKAYGQDRSLDRKVQKKPSVTREKIYDIATQIVCDYPDVVFPNMITVVKYIAKEFGVEVE